VGASHQTGWTGLVALLLQPHVFGPTGVVPLAGVADAELQAFAGAK
jgi:hypothetical protein